MQPKQAVGPGQEQLSFSPDGSRGRKRLTLTTQLLRTWHAVLFASLLAFPTLAFSAVSAERRAQARATYDRALRLRTTLESQPQNARRKADYEKVIQTFHAVYRLNPASSKAPVALAAIAEIYEEIGRAFSSNRYFLQSIRAYQFLISQYPQNPVSSDALYTIGETYRTDLENPGEARKAFAKFLEQYPKSAKAGEVQEKLKQLKELRPERLESRSAPRPPATENLREDQVPEVTALRRWVGPDNTRIVIALEGEAKFDTIRLARPDRIVLDLSNTRLSPALVGKTFPVEDGYLHQVRIAQFRPTVTRVVLDVEKIEDYSVFTLPNPFRLVIDIHGASSKTAYQPSARQVPASAKTAPADVAGSHVSIPAPNPHHPAPRPSTRQVREQESASQTAGPTGKPEAESDLKETASLKSPSLPPPATSTLESGTSTPRETARVGEPVKSVAPTELGAPTLTRALGLKIGRVVIDPGHGGHDTGTIGPTGLREKDMVLDVALRLKKLIERSTESQVLLTRSDDTFIPLEERTAIANEKAADLFISIHANASRDRSARGIETYYLNFTSNPEALEVAARENATSQESVHQLQSLIQKIAMSEKVEESQQFAKLVEREVHSSLAKAGNTQKNRGVKKAPFVVLIGANMPSILAEISFLTNPRDERLLNRPDYRQKIAEGLYQGIVRYMNTLGKVRVAEQAHRDDRMRPPRTPAETTAQESSEADKPKF